MQTQSTKKHHAMSPTFQELESAGIDSSRAMQLRDNTISARYISTRGHNLPSEYGIYGRIENSGLDRDFYKVSPGKRQMNEFNKNWVRNQTSVINF